MSFFGGPAKPVQTYTPEPEEPAVERAELPSPRANTLITKGITVSGSIQGHGVIQVEGVVKGQIVLNGAVIVTTTGSIEGPVTANVIQIAGSIRGNCVAREHMCLEKTGNLEGDVTTISLIVHDGGRLNGRSNMVKTIDAKATAAPSAPAEELEFGPNYKAKG